MRLNRTRAGASQAARFALMFVALLLPLPANGAERGELPFADFDSDFAGW